MIVGALATILALVALHRLDGIDGRRARRFLPAHWWKFTAVDAVVIGTLVLWHFIGANTSDDGYLLDMARVSEHAGYMANYFRWFGVPEAPFGLVLRRPRGAGEGLHRRARGCDCPRCSPASSAGW